MGLWGDLMSISCNTRTAAVESEGAACRLEAIFWYTLHTFVHLWALAHVVPFWSHPIVNGVVVHNHLHP